MLNFLNLIIPGLFYFLFFTVPLILYPYTSELFEFNKIVLVYILTVLIVAAWLSRCLAAKKFVFRRTILDIPLLVFLGTQLLSTIFSVDFRTSLLGYYSRFNGGLLSTISYSLLYWAFVSNMDKDKTLRAIKVLFISAVFVCLYGILEHFGIDKNIWVQDVQNRVFSTLGQPNWLAAFIVALMPLAWSYSIYNSQFTIYKQIPTTKWVIHSKVANLKTIIPFVLSILLFTTFLFTRSRSGLLGFLAADIIFWGFSFIKFKKQIVVPCIIHNSLFLILILLIGTPWTNSLITSHQSPVANQGPALETGGTESGEIRKIVWKGAIEIWKHYPILGTGVETFAYSYYNFRPVEHNLVSEWDFLYNKAHNEYLNYLATTGTLGFMSYLVLIGFSIYQILKNSKNPRIQESKQIKNENSKFDNFNLLGNFEFLSFGIFAGYISILITNFFGFSVVPISLLFFLFPAFAITLDNNQQPTTNYQLKKFSLFQKIFLLIVVGCGLWVVFTIGKYWYADILYNQGKSLNDQQKYIDARKILTEAIKLSPVESIFYDELSQSSTGIAFALNQANEKDRAKDFISEAISESQKAVDLSPANVNLKRSQTSLFLKLSLIDPNYLLNARDTLLETIKQAPTDAKLFYNLGLIYARIGDTQSALEILEKTIKLKPNYKEARFAYALILIDKKEFQKAKEQLNYILEKIDPNDALTKQQLEELK
jgi:putative inorganic carbon (HCO3(-)) transporter